MSSLSGRYVLCFLLHLWRIRSITIPISHNLPCWTIRRPKRLLSEWHLQKWQSSLRRYKHVHENKTILDQTTASYTSEEKNKLLSLYTASEIDNKLSMLETKFFKCLKCNISQLITDCFFVSILRLSQGFFCTEIWNGMVEAVSLYPQLSGKFLLR